MDYKTFKEAVIAAAKAAGLTEYEIYYNGGESVSISAFQHEINEFSSGVDGGVGFRCMVNGRMGYSSTEQFNDEQAASLVKRAMDNAATLEADEPVFLCEGGQTYEKLDRTPCELPGVEEMKEKLLDTQEKLLKADPAVMDVSESSVEASRVRIAITNSKGLDLSYENTLTALVTAAVVSDGTEMANDYQVEVKKLTDIDTDKMVAKAVKGAKEKLGGGPAPTGAYPVVFSSDAMRSLLATFSSIFSSEAAQKGLSKLGDKEGEVIAAPMVTLVDDPFYAESALPMPFDMEGSPTHRKNVIEAGKLTTLLYNLKTAAKAGKKTTGNASKRGYAGAIGISPFTMYLAPGSLTEEELLQKAGKGVFIEDLGGLHAGANPISGDFSLQSAGFMIEEGRKTEHVKSFTVAGNFYDLLKNITALSDKVELRGGGGITAFASPAVLVEGLSIAGK